MLNYQRVLFSPPQKKDLFWRSAFRRVTSNLSKHQQKSEKTNNAHTHCHMIIYNTLTNCGWWRNFAGQQVGLAAYVASPCPPTISGLWQRAGQSVPISIVNLVQGCRPSSPEGLNVSNFSTTKKYVTCNANCSKQRDSSIYIYIFIYYDIDIDIDV